MKFDVPIALHPAVIRAFCQHFPVHHPVGPGHGGQQPVHLDRLGEPHGPAHGQEGLARCRHPHRAAGPGADKLQPRDVRPEDPRGILGAGRRPEGLFCLSRMAVGGVYPQVKKGFHGADIPPGQRSLHGVPGRFAAAVEHNRPVVLGDDHRRGAFGPHQLHPEGIPAEGVPCPDGDRRRQQQGGVHRHGGGVAGLHRLGGGHLHRQPADGAFVARPVHGLGIRQRGGGGEGAGIQHPLRAVIAVVQGHVLLGGGQGHLSVAALGNDGSLGGRGILHHGEGHGGGGAGGLVGELHRHHVLALL